MSDWTAGFLTGISILPGILVVLLLWLVFDRVSTKAAAYTGCYVCDLGPAPESTPQIVKALRAWRHSVTRARRRWHRDEWAACWWNPELEHTTDALEQQRRISCTIPGCELARDGRVIVGADLATANALRHNQTVHGGAPMATIDGTPARLVAA